MTTNILRAIERLVTSLKINIPLATQQSNNRANNMGAGLERYIQDLFADTLYQLDEIERNKSVRDAFSYLGNQNNPPDLIIKSGDALEIKKIESAKSSIPLNSSYPKDKLYATDIRITKECRECENWIEKDIIYCIGHINEKDIQHLWFVYGDCYAASKNVYERISNAISSGITLIPDIEFSKTKELGKVNKVDPLGITDLRIRGMWHIANPTNVFKYIYNPQKSKFGMACLMRKSKYQSEDFSDSDRANIENHKNLKLDQVQIQDPNNPAKLIDAILIQYSEI